MTNIAVIENKLSSIRRYLDILASYRTVSLEEVESDTTLRGAIERYLYLLAQAAIDLADAFIAFRKLRKPATMAESFAILQEAGLLSRELAARLARMAGFRNILAHDYERLDYRIVLDVLHHHLRDVEDLVDAVSGSGRHGS
jgi:uncharacterized protein YutE (UPF0331/DUF86 family)